MKLNDRQLEIIKLINRFGYVNESAMCIYLNLTEKTVAKIGERLVKSGLIKKIKVLSYMSQFWVLSEIGAYVVNGKIISQITPSMILHNNYVHQLALKFLSDNQTVKLEKELRYELDKHFKASEIFLPDLILNNSIAFEIEITFKTVERIVKKISMYNFDSKITEVKWLSNNENILRRLQKIANNSKHKFYVFTDNILKYKEFINDKISSTNQQKGFIL